jgi:hypothetical protein
MLVEVISIFINMNHIDTWHLLQLLFFFSWFAVPPGEFVRLPAIVKTNIKVGHTELTTEEF